MPDAKFWNERLHYLLDYAKAFDDASEWFDGRESDEVVRAISEIEGIGPGGGLRCLSDGGAPQTNPGTTKA